MIEITILLACFGAVCILKYGTILNPIRRFLCKWKFFDELFKCSLCLGMHVGIIVGIGLIWFDVFRVIYIILPFASAGFCWFVDSVLRVVQTIELYLDKKLASRNTDSIIEDNNGQVSKHEDN